MRISTAQITRQQVNAMLDQQSRLAKTQLQLATGKQVITPSDDPQGMKVILDLNHAIELNQQFQRNSDQAVNRQQLEESVLGSVANVLQRARELTIQANSAALSGTDRRAIAAEIGERLEEMLSLANTQDSNGEYLFAGYKTDTQPFTTDGAGGFGYRGDDGQRRLRISPTLEVPVGDSGSAVFRAIPNGNGVIQTREGAGNAGDGVLTASGVTDLAQWQANRDTYTLTVNADGTYDVTDSGGGAVTSGAYSDGTDISFQGIQVRLTGTPEAGDTFTVSPSTNQDLFTTLQNLVDTLNGSQANPADRGHFQNAVQRVLMDLDQSLENISRVRTQVGGRLNTIESQQGINDDAILYAQQNLSEVQDLDYAEAVGRMQLQLTGLQAAQQAFVKVQGLSLFNFI